MGYHDNDTDEAGENPPASSSQPVREPDTTPSLELNLWPNRSLPRSGFRQILIFTAAMLAIPLIPLVGTPVGLALLPFLIGTLALLWFFIEKSYRDGRNQSEILRLWPDLITVTHKTAHGQTHHWHANPYWVEAQLHDDARIENYLTLRGNGREIELGAFLSPEERLALFSDIDRELRQVRRGPPPAP